MAQTSYSYVTDSGIAGGLYDIAPYEANSRALEGDDGAIGFGYGVVTGASAGVTVAVPSATTDTFEGVVVNRAHELTVDGVVVLKAGEAHSILSKGHIWAAVDPDITITAGESAYVSVTDGTAGLFTNDSTGLETGGIFITANDNGLAAVALH